VILGSVGEVIAERKFMLRGDSSPDREVLVLLGKPQPFSDSTDYYCPYQIKGIGGEKIKYLGGVDAFQAISFALQALGVELQVLNQTVNGKLRWDGDETGSLGFSIPE
jgi:hypothetical protein